MFPSASVNTSEGAQQCVLTPQLEITDLLPVSVKLKLVIKLQFNALG